MHVPSSTRVPLSSTRVPLSLPPRTIMLIQERTNVRKKTSAPTIASMRQILLPISFPCSADPKRITGGLLNDRRIRCPCTEVCEGDWTDRGQKMYVNTSTSDPCLSNHPCTPPSMLSTPTGSRSLLPTSLSIQSTGRGFLVPAIMG